MEAALFADAPMNLRERMLTLPLAERIDFDARSNMLFINFEGLAVDSPQDIEEIETEVARRVEPIGGRVDVVVNYDHFSIRPELMDAYSAMVRAPRRALLRARHALRGERLPEGAARAQAVNAGAEHGAH